MIHTCRICSVQPKLTTLRNRFLPSVIEHYDAITRDSFVNQCWITSTHLHTIGYNSSLTIWAFSQMLSNINREDETPVLRAPWGLLRLPYYHSRIRPDE